MSHVQDITIINYFFSKTLWQKTNIFLDIFLIFILSLNSKIMGMNMTMDFYGLKMCLCMECRQMKKLNIL
jgi:hypothetical protein